MKRLIGIFCWKNKCRTHKDLLGTYSSSTYIYQYYNMTTWDVPSVFTSGYARFTKFATMHVCGLCSRTTLRWRHNGRDSVSNHQPHDCLLNRLFRRRSKKTSKLRVTGLCMGNSPGTGEFLAQMASNAENVSIWWRHHEQCNKGITQAYLAWFDKSREDKSNVSFSIKSQLHHTYPQLDISETHSTWDVTLAAIAATTILVPSHPCPATTIQYNLVACENTHK